MQIRQIELTCFRNYEKQTIVVAPGINVFFGDNAQGKTNILEAVYLCACARSHRTSRDTDMIRHQADQYAVKLDFINQNGSEDEIELNYQDAVAGDPQRTRSSRIVRHNSIRLDKIGDMMGLFHAVIFAPEDLMLVKEGPATRRRYLDLLISQVRPSYFLALQQFSRQMLQRNKLLKDLRASRRSIRTVEDLTEAEVLQLDIWNQSLAAQAAGLIEQRLAYARRISELAGTAQEKISLGQERLFVRYRTVSGIKPEMSRSQICEAYYQKLQNSFSEDLEKEQPAADHTGTTLSYHWTGKGSSHLHRKASNARRSWRSSWPNWLSCGRIPVRRRFCFWTTSCPNWMKTDGPVCWKASTMPKFL